MFLGTAGVGKSSLKQSLMKEPWDPSSINSTIISDVHSIRPVGYQWQNIGRAGANDQWREVTEEDEIQEMGSLLAMATVHSDAGFGEFKSKMRATQLFPIVPETSSSSIAVSKQKVEELERTHVNSVLSKAIDYAESITSSHITPQPFVHMWDCGGQPVFLEILPAFLTSRTMFLLIYDASKSFNERWKTVQTIQGESKDEGEVNLTTLDLMHSWLSNIHIHLADYDSEGGLLEYPRVLIIGTHGDKVEDVDSKINELASYFKGKPFEALIDGFYIVNNTTAGTENEDVNFSEIRQKICEFTSDKLIVKTPISWVLFRNVIGDYKANVISLKEAQAIGVACEIPTEVVSKVLLFYHDLGVLLFYPHIKGLQDRVIINPKWFVNALGKVLTLEGRENYKTRLMWDLLRVKGILVQPLYVAAWREVHDISPEALIELLVHFRLAAKVTTDEFHDPDVKQYFLPLVLPSYIQQEPLSGYLQRATPLHLTFRTRFVPPGFFTRLVTILAESSKCKIRFNKGVYRDKIQIYYGHLPCDDVMLTEFTHAIQVEIFRYCPENESLPKFTDVCQMLQNDLLKVSIEVDHCLFGSSINKKSKVFKDFRFLCTVCSPTHPAHYLHHNDFQTTDLHVSCELNDEYRQISVEESQWFPKVKRNKKSFTHLPSWEAFVAKPHNNAGHDSDKSELDDFSKLHQSTQLVRQDEYQHERTTSDASLYTSSFGKMSYDNSTLQVADNTHVSPLTLQSVLLPQIPQVDNVPPVIPSVEISDNDILRCARYIEEGGINKLIRVLDLPSLKLQSVIQDGDDAQIKAYHILKKWLQANPNTTKDTLQEKLQILGFQKAAKKLCSESSSSENKTCVIN